MLEVEQVGDRGGVMTREEAEAIYNDDTRERQCAEYLKASAAVTAGMSEGHPTEATPHMLAALLASEAVFLNNHWWEKEWPEDARKTVAICASCNDVFAWACSDAEGVNYSEIPDIFAHWLKDPDWGVAVWCMKKRNQMPQKPVEQRIRASGI